MERLLLLWDELDEVVSYGRHMVANWGFRRGDRSSS
jgi:hypothetical protein